MEKIKRVINIKGLGPGSRQGWPRRLHWHSMGSALGLLEGCLVPREQRWLPDCPPRSPTRGSLFAWPTLPCWSCPPPLNYHPHQIAPGLGLEWADHWARLFDLGPWMQKIQGDRWHSQPPSKLPRTQAFEHGRWSHSPSSWCHWTPCCRKLACMSLWSPSSRRAPYHVLRQCLRPWQIWS